MWRPDRSKGEYRAENVQAGRDRAARNMWAQRHDPKFREMYRVSKRVARLILSDAPAKEILFWCDYFDTLKAS